MRRDIRWYTGKMKKPGGYLVWMEFTGDVGKWLENIYIYWDGKSDEVNDWNQNRYPIDNIIRWAYDGDD